MSAPRRTYFVCPAPPCPNGKLHLGHIGGVYLLADIFARFQRMMGHDAHLLTGADEHGSYTWVKARKLGRPVGDVADQHSAEILRCLALMGITVDVFVRTASRDHVAVSRGIFDDLRSAGCVSVQEGAQLYCDACGVFAADSLAVGRCPDCGAPCDSNLCENCGLAVDHASLRDPVHPPCGGRLALRPIAQACLNLDAVEPALKDAVDGSEWDEGVKRRAAEWLSTRARPLPMSRYFPHGVTVEEPAAIAGQTLLTWFEGLWCVETGIRQLCERDGASYPETMRDPGTRLHFFMGQDNRFYYTVGITASLIARGFPAPSGQAVQDFINFEGEKFSTSRDHALWADETAALIDQSLLRYALATLAAPFGTGGKDFTLAGIAEAADRLRRYEAALRGASDRAIPPVAAALSAAQVEAVSTYGAAIDRARFQDALGAIDRFFDQAALSRVSEGAAATAADIDVLLGLLHPFVPEMSKRYAACFFDDWRPSLDASAAAPGRPSAPADFPWFSTPPSSSFVSAYRSRLRRTAA